MRGGIHYFQPGAPWLRRGLSVASKYDEGNDQWLSMDCNPNEWAVAFHGFKMPDYVLPKVVNEGLRIGPNNGFGQGVYCTPKI